MTNDRASEGPVEQLAAQYGLLTCVECGKCVSACPMAEIFADFSYEVSPRGVIERVLLGHETSGDPGIWFCLTCDVCTDLCPAGVRFRDFVDAVRHLSIRAGITGFGSFCRRCGQYICPQHTSRHLKRLLGTTGEETIALCPRCRRYELGETMQGLLPGRQRVPPRPSNHDTEGPSR